jgi:hypothetical protein
MTTKEQELEQLATNTADLIRNIFIHTAWKAGSIADQECRSHVLEALQSATADLREQVEALKTDRDEWRAISNLAQMVLNSRQNVGTRMIDAAEVTAKIANGKLAAIAQQEGE